MKKTTLLIFSLIVLVLLNIGTLGFILYSKKKSPEGFRPGTEPSTFIIQQLKLNEQQQKEFKILREQHHSAAEEMRQKDKQLHDAFFDLLKTDNPDKQKADSIASLVATQQKLLVTGAFDHFSALRNICSDPQKKLFDENINKIAQIVAGGRPQQGPPPPHPGGPHP